MLIHLVGEEDVAREKLLILSCEKEVTAKRFNRERPSIGKEGQTLVLGNA